MDKLSYGIGVLMASNLKQQGIDKIDGKDFLAGFEAILAGQTPEVSSQEANAIISDFIGNGVAKTNLEEGIKYLTENGKRAEITTLASGLQYEVLTEGTGAMPKATDSVTTHYHGSLINGEVFDSSVNRGQPATFPVNGVIPGWVEALQLMKEGSKWKLHIPPNLGYGEAGAGGAIGPNATLIFDVELIKIN